MSKLTQQRSAYKLTFHLHLLQLCLPLQKIAAYGLKETSQMPPYITPMLSMLCLNFNIHCEYSNCLSSLRSFDISNTHQYNFIAVISKKAYPFFFSHHFKVILDTIKTRKKQNFSWRVSGGQGNFYLYFLLLSTFRYFYNF